jgi:hypothetical protein
MTARKTDVVKIWLDSAGGLMPKVKPEVYSAVAAAPRPRRRDDRIRAWFAASCPVSLPKTIPTCAMTLLLLKQASWDKLS